ncbi:hypothetical protein LCGC14_2915960, partial [marine sediment metagenome]
MHAMVSIDKVPSDQMQSVTWHVTNLTQSQYDKLCDELLETLNRFMQRFPVVIK